MKKYTRWQDGPLRLRERLVIIKHVGKPFGFWGDNKIWGIKYKIVIKKFYVLFKENQKTGMETQFL